MTIKASLRRRLTASAAGAVLMSVGVPALAQTQDAPPVAAGPTEEEATAVEEVVVTGSRIRRDATTAPTNLIVVDREEVLRSGEPNVVDFLADIPALTGSQVPEDTTAFLNGGGLSLLNLRDLGAVRTLVLVDGRRHVGGPQGSLAVDVDTIPAPLIGNIEIITGGASAIYGADAVSGVVNFIQRRDFDGLEVDAALSEVNEDGQLSGRASLLVGRNFFDDRLNVYGFAEYQHVDEIQDRDIDWRRRGGLLLNNDTDTAGVPFDGQFDNILIFGARDLSRPPDGGILILSSQVFPTLPFTGDPDIPFQACPTAIPTIQVAFNANCFAAEPATSFLFNSSGVARTPNFGTFRDQNGYARTIVVGGDGPNPLTERNQRSRTPESENLRFQAGINFRVTDWLSVFGEAKYVEEDTEFFTQPSFFDIGIAAVPAGQVPGLFATSSFNIGLDNAYLDPAVRNAILANRRPIINANGVVTSTIADPRARFSVFGTDVAGYRRQTNERELERYVLGVRGDRDQLGFINNFAYEVGYTYGQTTNFNEEGGAVDVTRFSYQVDAVVDTNGIVNGNRGEIVCRVRLLRAQGVTLLDPQSNGVIGVQSAAVGGVPADTAYSASNPTIQGCVPGRVFGSGGFSEAARAYSNAAINVQHVNEQRDLLAFASGELWDFWGAGRIGVAAGYERREEFTEGVGRSASTAGRLLFLNTGPDFAAAEYEVDEFFGEIRLPLLRDLPFVQSLEANAAYRYSDYSTIGGTDVYGVNLLYRPTQDLLLRASYNESVRVPNLNESFAPGTQTFGNGLVDPCDRLALTNTTIDATIRASRRTNCVALLGAGYNPDTQELVYTSGVPGRNAGNPNLTEEQSRSYTWSIVMTPRFIPNFSLVFDYYDIKITDVIAAVAVQTALNQCVSGAVLNQAACGTLTRDPANFRLTDFLQGSLNYASTLAKGVDFTARYRYDLDNVMGRDLGRLDLSLRGNYLIRQEDFVNIDDPSQADEFDSTVGLPRVRFLTAVTYSPSDRFSVTWEWDYQSPQEILDEDVFLRDPDNRELRFYDTRAFNQHDFSIRYQVRDDVTVRAGIVNAFDEEPDAYLGDTTADNFDFFGRRFFIGLNLRR